MEKIGSREYKGFITNFYILPKIKKFLDKRSIQIMDHFEDNFHWYEQKVFELLDPLEDGSWDMEKETRRKFKVVLYGVIKRLVNERADLYEESSVFGEKNVLSDVNKTINIKNEKPFAIKYKIILDR